MHETLKRDDTKENDAKKNVKQRDRTKISSLRYFFVFQVIILEK